MNDRKYNGRTHLIYNTHKIHEIFRIKLNGLLLYEDNFEIHQT